VTNEDGQLIATAELSEPKPEDSACVSTFAIENVPKAEFYRFRFGDVQGPTLSYDEMEANDWRVEGFAS
jgi:hypothetical protein